MWVTTPLPGGWLLAQRLGTQGGECVVVEVRVYPDETPPIVNGVQGGWVPKAPGEWSGSVAAVPKGGLSGTTLSGAPLGRASAAAVAKDYVDFVLNKIEHSAKTSRTRAQAQAVAEDLGFVAPARSQREPGRPGRKPSRKREFYERIAGEYRRWARSKPAKRIADKHRVSRATARTWIHTARHVLKLLPATDQGRASVFESRKR